MGVALCPFCLQQTASCSCVKAGKVRPGKVRPGRKGEGRKASSHLLWGAAHRALAAGAAKRAHQLPQLLQLLQLPPQFRHLAPAAVAPHSVRRVEALGAVHESCPPPAPRHYVKYRSLCMYMDSATSTAEGPALRGSEMLYMHSACPCMEMSKRCQAIQTYAPS